MEEESLTGGCACGAVRFTARGAPVRAGLCHCMTCRKAHAAVFNPFVIYRTGQVEIAGELRDWESSEGYRRRFCPRCGSRIVGETIGSGEVELSMGSLDETGRVEPLYESWVIRREPWLAALDLPQHARNRPEDWTRSTLDEG